MINISMWKSFHNVGYDQRILLIYAIVNSIYIFVLTILNKFVYIRIQFDIFLRYNFGKVTGDELAKRSG
jgi:hypothetical protein